MRTAVEIVAALSLAGLLAACSAPPDDPNPPMTAAERASLQNECAKIADRSEREECLRRAAFDERWQPMLLRSVMRHVREQNWTAFGIEFLIVVIGVLRRQVVFVQGDHEVRPGLA